MPILPRTGFGRAVPVIALVATSVLSMGRATATDIEVLREQAQTLGQRVTSLEVELRHLNGKSAELKADMEITSRRIGLLELQKHELGAAKDEAMNRYVTRAVEAYKEGPTARVELVLSSATMSELLTIAVAQTRAADRDARSLKDLMRAETWVQAKQDEIDDRQIELAATAARIDTVTSEMSSTVEERRAVLDQIVEQIAEIEQQARLAAAASASPDETLLEKLAPSGPAPGVPDGFAGTGVRFEGIASWYGPGFEGNHTANGDVFDPDLYTAASRDLPLGTWLYVTHEGRGVVVLVNDRGPFIEGRILDLSQAAAEAIGITGLGWIEAEILIKT